MLVVIAGVDKNIFSGEAESLTVPTTEGDITVLPNHEPFVAALVTGVATVKTLSGPQSFPLTAGVIEVSHNRATVLL